MLSSPADLLLATKDKSSQSSFENYKSLPEFITFAAGKNGQNVFKIDSQSRKDVGLYEIRVQAEVYNPFNRTVYISDAFTWNLLVYVPRKENAPPVFQMQPLPVNLDVAINIVSSSSDDDE